MYDVIVVGARCAGSPTAMLLARQGHRVLLLDRATFPSDTNSTHYVQQPAVARLREWGVIDDVLASGCPPIETYGLDFGAFALRGRPTPYAGEALAYGPRRILLDAVLVEAASTTGAAVETGFTVEELMFDGDAVVGLRGRTEDGTAVNERARVVVGADGLHSVVAQRRRCSGLRRPRRAAMCVLRVLERRADDRSRLVCPRGHRRGGDRDERRPHLHPRRVAA